MEDTEELFFEGDARAFRLVFRFSQPFRPLAEKFGVLAGRLRRGFLDQVSSYHQLDMDVLLGGHTLDESAAPSLEVVDPSFDRVLIAA